ncbi:MAG: flagellar basal body P-ring formation chaperone FlgA [Acidithiobacillus sp.]
MSSKDKTSPTAFACMVAALGAMTGPSLAHADGPWENPEQIRGAVAAFVKAHLPGNAAQAHIVVQGLAEGLHFPACRQMRMGFFGYSNPYGSQTVAVTCTAPSVWTVYIPVQLVMNQAVVVAARPLAAGTVLAADDLSIIQRNASNLASSAVVNPQIAVGQVLRFGVAAGQPILASMLDAPEVVHAGQEITLIAEGDGVRISTIAKAMENGRPGQTILVRNNSSGKVIRGTVDQAGAVLVPF